MSYIFGNSGCAIFDSKQNVSLQAIKQVFADEDGETYEDEGIMTFSIFISGLSETLIHVETEILEDSVNKLIFKEFIKLVKDGKDIDLDELIQNKKQEHEEKLRKSEENREKLKRRKRNSNIISFPKMGDSL